MTECCDHGYPVNSECPSCRCDELEKELGKANEILFSARGLILRKANRSRAKARQAAKKYDFQMERFHLGKQAGLLEALAVIEQAGTDNAKREPAKEEL